MEHQAYRCCLPTLAGFAGNHCIGPGFQRRPAVYSPTSPPRRGIRPSYSGLLDNPELLQGKGTANSPSSTTKTPAPTLRAVIQNLEPTVGIEPTTLLRITPSRIRSCSTHENWSQRSESNRRPAVYETAALPAELRWHRWFFNQNSTRKRELFLEPTTLLRRRAAHSELLYSDRVGASH